MSPLLTDLYQITMAYGYWRLGMHERPAVFHQLFRKQPFKGNYAVAAGLASVMDFLRHWHFSEADLAYLADLPAPAGGKLFPADFLAYLRELRFTCDVDAVPEGTLVFAHAPLLRITGPLLQCQLIETALLDFINFQTLIATKAARVCQAAAGDPVLEFGLRRAQGPDGALSASRAAYIGGCMATSNVLAGQRFDIPLSGTQAHSWVTAFPDEQHAFDAYADVMPNNFVLLVDTYDTIQGVEHAIVTATAMRKKGVTLRAIRLDSGDMAPLSIAARRLLDAAGLHETQIIASNSLDEYEIIRLKQAGAAISIWGVGTRLVTAHDQPALDGVYKLTALASMAGDWEYKLKISDTAEKVSNPGIQQVRRYLRQGVPCADLIYDIPTGVSPQQVSLSTPHLTDAIEDYDTYVDLLQPIFRAGTCVYVPPDIHTTRATAQQAVQDFCQTMGEKVYPVGLEKNLHTIKLQLMSLQGVSV